MNIQTPLLLHRTIFRKIFSHFTKRSTQWLSKIDQVRNVNHMKSLRWSIKQVLYLLAWVQLWNKRKNWFYTSLKMRRNGWKVWKGGSLMGAAFFNFGSEGIKNEEIDNALEDSENPNPQSNPNNSDPSPNQNANSWMNGLLVTADTKNKLCENGWECLMMKNDLLIYRKLKPNSTTYTYKVFGRYKDISASDFLFTQVDNGYRRSWDKYITELECLDESEETNQELLYWIVKYPYPMMSRDYLLVRRTIVDRDKNRIAIITRSTKHKQCPPKESLVRVDEYESTMLLYPHTRIDKGGFDFQLTSVDNPKTNLPRPITNYAITSAIPDFISRMHLATRQLNQVTSEECPQIE